MTITISINIQLDPDDLAAFGYHAAAAWAALLTPPTTTAPAAPVPAPTRKSSAKSAKTAHIDVKPQNGPETPGTPVLVPDVPASDVAPETTAIPAPTKESEATEPEAPRHSGDRLPFDQLDPLVRKEIKRLAMDGRIPSARLWDAERNKRLPTYGAVMQRYGCTNLHDFAERMNMQPPLSPKRFPEHRGEVYATTA